MNLVVVRSMGSEAIPEKQFVPGTGWLKACASIFCSPAWYSGLVQGHTAVGSAGRVAYALLNGAPCRPLWKSDSEAGARSCPHGHNFPSVLSTSVPVVL